MYLGIIPGMTVGPYVVPGSKHESNPCKAIVLPIVLSLWPFAPIFKRTKVVIYRLNPNINQWILPPRP